MANNKKKHSSPGNGYAGKSYKNLVTEKAAAEARHSAVENGVPAGNSFQAASHNPVENPKQGISKDDIPKDAPSLDTPMTARAELEQLEAATKKKKRFHISTNWLNQKKVLAIIAFICSFSIWCFVTFSDDNTSSTRQVTDVPIRIDTTDIEQTFGLQKIDIVDPPAISDGLVDVTLHGTVYQLSQVRDEDIVVSAAVSGVNRAGESTLGLSASCNVRGVTVTINSNYNFVKVWFDRIKQKTISVDKITANGVTVAEDDLIVGDSVSNIKTLTIIGPESVIEDISMAQISADVNQELSEPLEVPGSLKYMSTEGVEPSRYHSGFISIYDYNDTESASGTPAGAPEDIKVIVPVSKTATLPLGLSFKNAPDGFDFNSLKYSVSPAEIKIEGDIEAVNKYIDAGVYNLEGIDISAVSPVNNTVQTKLNLSTGIEELSGISDVNVKFKLDGYSTRTLTLDRSRIKVIENSSLKTKLVTESLNVRLVGPSKAVESITEADCTASVDMTEAELSDGQRKVPAVISLHNKPSCWSLGSYTVMVQTEVTDVIEEQTDVQ